MADSTDIISILEVDRSSISPVGSPRVTDDPDGGSGHGGPSGELDSVVELTTASRGRGDDSGDIGLPDGGINTDGWWSSSVGELLHGGLIVGLGDVLPAGDLGSDVGSRELAGSADLSVWVRGIGIDSSVFDDVLVGIWWVSSVASLVDSVAVNELLHGELDERVSGDEPLGFNGFGGREGPARSALLLVVDWSQGSLGGPVI